MKKTLLLLLTFAGSVSAFSQTAFLPGSLAVYRVGITPGPLSAAATASFVDEYTIAGVLLRSLAMPVATPGALTNSGTATSEGLITRTTDGTAVMVTGYDAAPGLTPVVSTTSAAVNRNVAVIKADGSVDVSTRLTDYVSASNPRSAVSTNGSTFWLSGGNGGVRNAALGGTTSTSVSTTTANVRQLGIFNGNLYYTTGSATIGFYQVGTGLPTASATVSTLLFASIGGSPSPYGFSVNPAGDVVYIADDRTTANTGGIQKWTLSGGIWSQAYVLATGATNGARSVYVDYSGPIPIIYATTTEANANRLVTIVDAGVASVFATIATAPAGTVFRGVALAPQLSVVGLRFTSFTGNNARSGYDLNWSTANETNVSAFTVQKSNDGVTFEDVISQSARNNSSTASYNYTYTGIEKGAVYFRIKATELSGRAFYSDIIKSDKVTAAGTFNVSPNIGTNDITLNYGSLAGAGNITVINTNGTIILTKNTSGSRVSEQLDISSFRPGIYFVKYITADGKVQTERFVKQ